MVYFLATHARPLGLRFLPPAFTFPTQPPKPGHSASPGSHLPHEAAGKLSQSCLANDLAPSRSGHSEGLTLVNPTEESNQPTLGPRTAARNPILQPTEATFAVGRLPVPRGRLVCVCVCVWEAARAMGFPGRRGGTAGAGGLLSAGTRAAHPGLPPSEGTTGRAQSGVCRSSPPRAPVFAGIVSHHSEKDTPRPPPRHSRAPHASRGGRTSALPPRRGLGLALGALGRPANPSLPGLPWRAGGRGRRLPETLRAGGAGRLCGSPARREFARPPPGGKWGRAAGCRAPRGGHLRGSHAGARSTALRLRSGVSRPAEPGRASCPPGPWEPVCGGQEEPGPLPATASPRGDSLLEADPRAEAGRGGGVPSALWRGLLLPEALGARGLPTKRRLRIALRRLARLEARAERLWPLRGQ